MADLALAIVAGTVGAMVFFGAIVAPTAFGTLGEQQAGPFIRALFPRYYLLFSATSFAACAAALKLQTAEPATASSRCEP